MINSNMKPVDVYTIKPSNDNDLNVKVETPTFLKTIDCFLALRSTEDKMIDVYSYEKADYIGITVDKTVIKGNILKANNEEFKVVESLNILRNNNLLLKKVK